MAGEGFAVDASLISADANKVRSIAAENWSPEVAREVGTWEGREYLDTLDNTAFEAASPVQPKLVARADPAESIQDPLAIELRPILTSNMVAASCLMTT